MTCEPMAPLEEPPGSGCCCWVSRMTFLMPQVTAVFRRETGRMGVEPAGENIGFSVHRTRPIWNAQNSSSFKCHYSLFVSANDSALVGQHFLEVCVCQVHFVLIVLYESGWDSNADLKGTYYAHFCFLACPSLMSTWNVSNMLWSKKLKDWA